MELSSLENSALPKSFIESVTRGSSRLKFEKNSLLVTFTIVAGGGEVGDESTNVKHHRVTDKTKQYQIEEEEEEEEEIIPFAIAEFFHAFTTFT